MRPLEKAISHQLIPALIGHPTLASNARALLGLPCRLGGMGLSNPAAGAEHNQSASKRVCQLPVDLIMQQEGDVMEGRIKQQNIKWTIRKE